ncbi:MAG: class E sortase [Acidimicrobiia bacterium]
MTAVEQRRPVELALVEDEPEVDAAPRSRRPNPFALAVVSLIVLVVLLAVFEYWVTTVQEARSQTSLLGQMKRTLSTAAKGGASPRPLAGQPLGLMEIPAIGVEKVVVEGASPSRLKTGPGRVPSSAFPGRPGDTLILGKRSAYGKPFAHLDALEDGDEIVLTTGAGRFRYVVDAGARRAQPGSKRSTLTLATSSPALLSSGVRTVVAKLDGRPLLAERSDAGARTIDPAADAGFFSDSGAFLAVAIWGLLLIVVLVIAARGYRRSPWLAWLLTTPVVVALLFCLLGSLDRLLPATR